jgi:3-dehydroquinate dehydratase/shikimate dehydrogenase
MSEARTAKICVPVCVRGAKDLTSAASRASRAADIIELRLDCLEASELKRAQPALKSLLQHSTGSFILTFRPAEQGGYRALSNIERLGFWSELLAGEHISQHRTPIYTDLELELALQFQSEKRAPDWRFVICSHHDFTGLPANLEQLYERMAATPAGILKIAVRADDVTDCIPLFRLLERARREGREMIALAMGQAGVATRILGLSRGAFLTYGSLDEAQATAPGQLTAANLRELYRADRLNRQTAIMGLVGLPVSHSVSPQIHNRAFAVQDLNAVYIPFEVHRLEEFVRRLVHPRSREVDWNLRGLSVTAPYKNAVIEHLDWIEPGALEIGAVNTIVVEEDVLKGYNTDAAAFVGPLEEKLGSLCGLRVAVIGAGGAASSALWSLHSAGADITLFARSRERARPLAKKFEVHCEQLDKAQFGNFDVVVNSTPVGTRGEKENETPATSEQLRGARLVYDLIYNPCETRLMREAKRAGCETLGGLSMLVEQAAEQFRLWTGQPAPLEIMFNAAQSALGGARGPDKF